MPIIDSDIIPLDRNMVGFDPGATSMKAIAPPPATIGTYVRIA
ncbi:hypothetical protein GCM10027176_65650 [Actinoallomurus bryophytorum]